MTRLSIDRPIWQFIFVSLVSWLLASPDVDASDDGFRISTKIYVGEEGKKDTRLVSESTTLFLDKAVYDFLADGSQIAVFHKAAGEGRFILLNPDKRIRTELSTAQVAGAMQKIREWAGKQRDPMLQFAANPKFEETYDPAEERLVLASHLETYTVTTEPVTHPEATAKYREFLHWYTQLNTLLHAGPPPEPRLRLNEALARHRVLPQTVQLTRTGDDKPLRAEHEFTMRLSRDDEERIDEVRTSVASFRDVTNEEFLKAGQNQIVNK
jgi:hypothetical protein